MIIVLTDGQSVNRTHTLQEAQRVHEEGMYMFAVGIGSSTDVDELMALASNPDENFMFHVDNFAGLTSIRDLLAIKTCDGKPRYSSFLLSFLLLVYYTLSLSLCLSLSYFFFFFFKCMLGVFNYAYRWENKDKKNNLCPHTTILVLLSGLGQSV